MYRYLFGALADSFTLIPINGVTFHADSLLNSMIEFMNDYILIGFRIVLPIFCVTLLLNAILGVLAKVSPQMNMFSTTREAMILASFAEMVSRSDDSSRYGHSDRPSGLLFPHFHARQATLHAAHDSVHRLAGSYLIRTRSEPPKRLQPSSHKLQVSTETGSYASCRCARPESLTPSIHPKLGVTSRHQGLHRCALQRIFRPFLEDGHPD